MAERSHEGPGPLFAERDSATFIRRPQAAIKAQSARRILVVEDSPVVRLYLKHSLEKPQLHCEVVLASDGFEALEALEQGDFDLIFCDLNMPHLDGRDFCKVLTSKPQRALRRVVIFTSDYHCRHEAQFEQDPLFMFLQKPASAQEIQRLVLRELA